MAEPLPPKNDLSAREAAERLGVNERTVRRAIARGDLPARKLGRSFEISEESLLQYRPLDLRPDPNSNHPDDQPLAFPHIPVDGGFAPLPRPSGPIFGRDTELAALIALLRDDGSARRLVTVTGPGGIGKTRLALEAAARLEPEYSGGVAFLSLAPVTDPDLLVPAILRAFGLRQANGPDPLRSIQDAVAGHRTLLILDNMEQLLPAAPILPRLLAIAPSLAILATSRAVLHVSGEQTLSLPPLSGRGSHQADDGRHSPGVDLFLGRASATGLDLDTSRESVAILEAICTRLDGLPLAIELAAAQVKILPPRAILTHLDRRLHFLNRGNRDAPARQQTMNAAIDWSHHLLPPPERVLFRRLAAFPGGATVAAADAMSEWTPDASTLTPISPVESTSLVPVLDSLGILVDHSLLYRSDDLDGEPRFAMLETVREFGLDRLQECGESARATGALANLALDLVERQPLAMNRHRGTLGPILDRLEAEHANTLAGLAWATTHDPPTARRIAAGLWRFWSTRGHIIEGRRWLDAILARIDVHPAGFPPDDLLHAEIAYGAGSLAWSQQDAPEAIAHFTQSLMLRRRADDSVGIAHALRRLGGIYVRLVDPSPAEHLLTEGLSRFRALGDATGAGGCLVNLGLLAQARRDLEAARSFLDQAVAAVRLDDDPEHTAYALCTLGEVALDAGSTLDATIAFGESLALFRDIGDRQGSLDALAGIAAVARARGRGSEADRLSAQTLDLRRRHGMLAPSTARTASAPYPAPTPLATSPTISDGPPAVLDFADVISESIDLVARLSAAITEDIDRSRPLDLLSPREREVLDLVVEGQTDRDIATVLNLSPRTVMHHVARIRAKLGVSSRTAAATIAIRESHR